ncbi:MAG: GspH/FimT family pseudopilin [Deltaproteobacteria bacterium]|nr:GspH/FimT family pseudopilin [Deltaproteobacteria bacterium]
MVKKRSFCFWKILKNRKGFTMTEVVVVLGILGIMTAISIPSYFSYLPKHRLQTSVRQIYDDMQLAKIRAVKDNRNACIEFYPGTETYTVFFDVDGIAGYLNGTDILIKGNVTLENGVDITITTLPTHTSGFNNRGMLPAGAGPGVVRLTNPTGLLMGVEVMNTAGGIRIVTSTDGWVTWS